MSKPRWLTIEHTQGSPIYVGDKTLIPLARRIAIHLDFFGTQGGGGGGFEHVQPIGVAEQIDAVTRRIPVEDVTGAALRSMVIGALVVGGLAWLARLFVVPRPRRRSEHDAQKDDGHD